MERERSILATNPQSPIQNPKLCDYGGVLQRWFVVESQERKKADLKQLDKTIAKVTTHWQSQLRQLCCQEFACVADALAAIKRFEQDLPWHQLTEISVKQKLHYDRILDFRF